MSTIDIISIHNTLVRKYQQQTTDSAAEDSSTSYEEEYKKWKELYDSLLQQKNASKNVVQDIRNKLETLKEDHKKQDHRFYFYLMRAIPVLDRYCSLKKSQNKINFLSNRNHDEDPEDNNKDMEETIREYMTIVEDYFPEDYSVWNKTKSEDVKEASLSLCKSFSKLRCSICNNDQDSFSIYDNHFVCEKCGFVSTTTHTNISYKDIDRVNISSKYTYDRRTHFRDCINQFQGKQNASIDPRVYEDIIEQLVLHGLLQPNYKDQPKSVAFQDISKEQVLIFLKETGHAKHYEDVVLIHHQLTDKPVQDISHLENDLLRDFDMLTDLYDKKYKNSERKNFINTQYVLYQLLRRHKYPCRKEDFNILKTIDRKYYHDTICADLFMALGWNFQALF